MMISEIEQQFIDAAQELFSFLVESHSFAGPYIEHDAKTGFVTIFFVGKNLAVECIFDPREKDVDCKIAKIVNGKIAEDYSVDYKGDTVRLSLAKLLRNRGVNDRLFTKVSGFSIEDRLKITINDFVNMLKNHGADVLKDDANFLCAVRRLE